MQIEEVEPSMPMKSISCECGQTFTAYGYNVAATATNAFNDHDCRRDRSIVAFTSIGQNEYLNANPKTQSYLSLWNDIYILWFCSWRGKWFQRSRLSIWASKYVI